MSVKKFTGANDELASPAINSWVLALIDFGARRGRRSSALIVTGLVLFIGWIGYITGTRFSLYAFYLAPIILSVLWLGWRWGCAVSVACIVMRVAVDLAVGDKDMTLGIYWNRIGHLSLYLVLVGLLHAFNSLQRQLERRVQQRTAALAQALQARDELQRQLFESGSRERSRIGHELHDGLGQHLTATALAAKMLSSELEATGHPGAADAGTIVRMAQDGIAQTRQLARGLLLAAIEPDQLVAELEELCGELQKEYGIRCRFTRTGAPRGLDGERASHLYYIAHEAARNALRHARASQIEIELRTRPDLLELGITDNGSGLPGTEASLQGMGLRIMAHRSELIGGRFAITPAPGSGTCVTCAIALPVATPAY
jgi:signal transduction histidine kinase